MTKSGHFALIDRDGFLNDSVFCVSAAGLFVLVLWNPKEQDRLEPEVLSTARFLGNLLLAAIEKLPACCQWAGVHPVFR